MPSEVRSPRTLASWLELDYFRRRRLFSAWWWWILGGTLAGAFALVGVYASSGKRAFQAGPVSHPHALFNDDCGKCHEKAFTTFTRLWAGDSVGTVTDNACVQCHAGPPHHGAVGRCVDCHKEHRGHDTLMRHGEGKCVQCHADLDAVQDAKRTDIARQVRAFTAGGHPEFRTPAKRVRRFPHDKHLVDNGVPVRGPDGVVTSKKLDCADCHQIDDGGKFMKPISFDRHCVSCHPLGAQLTGAWKDKEMFRWARDFARERVAHPQRGQTVAVVRGSLRDALSRFIADPKHARFLDGGGEAPRPLPDRDPPQTEAAAREQFAWVGTQMKALDRLMFDSAGGCRYCHQIGKDKAGQPEIIKPDIPSRWWGRAVFRHDAHLKLDGLGCIDCHAAKDSTMTSEVMMPPMETCLKCHDTAKRNTARAGCVQCHIYHERKPGK